MKKIVFGLVSSLILVLAAITASSMSQGGSAGEPVVPGPSNPYCNKSLSDFTPPVGRCDLATHSQDAACIAACNATYKQCMLDAYNTACTAYNTANDGYVACFKLAISTYDTCYASATTLAEREICRNTMISQVADCVNNLNYTRSTIAQDVSSASAACKNTCLNCLDNCCHPN